jgi:hypothetical protein
VVYEPSKAFASMVLGMPYVEFDVPKKTVKGIADFYSKLMGTKASVKDAAAHVSVGYGQELIFRETDKPLAPYDGHHLQVYVANFSKPHDALVKRKILTEESNQYQYRFNDIVDPATGKKLFEIEHEIRSITHPLYARPLVNRNPRQTNRTYVQGRDGWVPEWEDADMGDPRRRTHDTDLRGDRRGPRREPALAPVRRLLVDGRCSPAVRWMLHRPFRSLPRACG